MAVISVPNYEPWVVGGQAFRTVLDPLIASLPDDKDRAEVVQARALKGLLFEDMPEGQAARIAAALIQVASDLRSKYSSNPDATEWEIELADRLGTLELVLEDLIR